MGIYLPNMEMPDRCFACPMCDVDCCGISRGSYIEYREVDVDTAIDHRPDWCPLVPVPPHGRLSDTDVMCKECRRVAEEYDGIYPDCTYCPVHLAPTIIPADKEGEG